MNTTSIESPATTIPWKLALVTALTVFLTGRFSKSYVQPNAGRAMLTQSIELGQSGLQLSLDAPRIWSGYPHKLEDILKNITGSPLSSEDIKTINTGPTLLSLMEGKSRTITPVQTPDLPKRVAGNPLFNGTPGAVFQWAKGAFRLRGRLYRAPERSPIYSGPVSAILPFPGFGRVLSKGFPIESAASLPPDCDRLLIVDPQLIQFNATYSEPVLAEWKRWEFAITPEIARALGRSFAYARWHGSSLFSFELRDSQPIKEAIAKRFPASVIPTTSKWIQGSKAYALGEEGPAWVIRGDNLIATRQGGLSLLDEAVSSALTASARGEQKESDPLWREIKRISAHQDGWNALVLINDPKIKLRWAAVLRWTSAASNEATGYLIIEPN